YPPAGPDGLRLATDSLSRGAPYLPEGPPNDAWGRPFHYVPHTEYGRPGSGAMCADDGTFYAPTAFQVYSLGGDGRAGVDNPGERQDNISNWEPARPWRAVYRQRQQAFRKGPS
ncbi:MAG: hypothetical protein JXR94_24900, partial [Candidatus Hydrogenedentes bacterium]|nr:hypothetical protein [Candidatus Hydrogenedentota bacterium]